MKKNRALIVIDVQNEYFTGSLPVTYPKNSINKILQCIDAANTNSLPIIYIQHTDIKPNSNAFIKNTHNWELYDALKHKPHTCTLEKNYPDSFYKTDLDNILNKLNIDTVVICGYMTQMCCDTTARRAFHLRYNVEFLSDATGTLDFTTSIGKASAKELQNSVLVIQSSTFSNVITTDNWIESLS